MKLEIVGDRAVLHTRATPLVMSLLPQIEGARKWLNGHTKLSVVATAHNLNLLRRIPGLVVHSDRKDPGAVALKIGTYKSKTVAYKHQVRAMENIRHLRNFALFMEQGTGKTKVLIDRAGELFANGEITGMLIATKKGVHRQWIEGEFPTHYGAEFEGSFWPIKQLPSSMLERSKKLKAFAINIDGLKTKAGFAVCEEFCKAHDGKLLLVCDESQDIKNDRSDRHSALSALKSYSEFRAIATGTPIGKDLTDSWSQFKWLDEDIVGVRYRTTFRRQFCIMGGFENRAVVGHKNVEQYKKLTEPFIFRATKAEIGILPKQYATWHYDLLPAQKAAIKSLRQELEAIVGDGKTIVAPNAAVVLGKLQQVASGFLLDENSVPHDVIPRSKNPRLQAVEEWLEAGEGKAAIWFRYRYEAVLIAERLQKMGLSYAEYHGGINDVGRKAAKDSFMAPNGVQVFLANPQSAGTGLNLQGLCNRILYYSNSFNAIDRWQSEDRFHRIGTNGIVTFTDLIAKGSTDSYTLRNLRNKKSLSDWVLDNIDEAFEDHT